MPNFKEKVLAVYTFQKDCSLTEMDSTDQAELVEKNTRQQARSKVWFQQKSGCVTASRVKSVISTDGRNHQYHWSNQFVILMHSVACWYGYKHEDTARKEYVYEINKKHVQFAITESGLVLDPLYPF